MTQFVAWLPILLTALLAIVLVLTFKLWLPLIGIRFVPDGSIGILSKKFVLFGAHKTLPDGAVVALNGEAGLQADTLAPGIHYGLWPWQYSLTLQPYTVIQEGEIGCVESLDGQPVAPGRVLARAVDCDSFQNARSFLTKGGQRGPQMAIVPPGSYRINTALFRIGRAKAIDIPDTKIGLVTTNDGNPLPTGEIAGGHIAGHTSFQNGEAFVTAGGSKGLQEQVLMAGRYYINPLFATVELTDLTTVPIAHVGVVIAYVGKEGKDVSGTDFKHGNLVSRGERGVWANALEPGKYAINQLTHKVELVPTANIVLNWATGKTEAHKLDANLSTITVRSADGFTFNLDVSQIIHIPHFEAPKVIARFGTMQNLVTQVLEPSIGNYFRNTAQSSDAIAFLTSRTDRQKEAKAAITLALDEYNVGAVDTLIGDIMPPPQLMETLTAKKLADQWKVTYEAQRTAEGERQKMEQARALAETQSTVVASEQAVKIANFNAAASVEQAKGAAEVKTVNATADAQVRKVNADAEAHAVIVTGNAEAGRTLAVGNAEAEVIEKKTKAMEAGNYASVEIARALSQSKNPIVPEVTMGGEKGAGSIVDLLALQWLRTPTNGNGQIK